MKIPDSFECIGTRYVVNRKNLPEKYGHFDAKNNEIALHKNMGEEREALTFWHEFFHCALHTLGYQKLSDNEKLVERLAQVTHQLEKTAVYSCSSESESS